MTPDGEARDPLQADRFRELLEAAPNAILEVDAEGRIALLNAAAEKMFGYRRDELLGQSIETLVPEDLRSLHEKHRIRYNDLPVTRPMGIGMELNGRRKDGCLFPIEVSLSPVKSATGFRVTAIIRDITDRKRAQERFQEIQNNMCASSSCAIVRCSAPTGSKPSFSSA